MRSQFNSVPLVMDILESPGRPIFVRLSRQVTTLPSRRDRYHSAKEKGGPKAALPLAALVAPTRPSEADKALLPALGLR
jgi:hypothetical protein